MEYTTIPLEEVRLKIENYSKTSYELAKLKSLKATAIVASTFIVYAILFLTISISLSVFFIGIAFWLGEILGKNYYGFYIVAAFFLVIFLFILVFLRKKIKESVVKYIFKLILA
jgi:Zn-dependent protease with chaperone function